MESGKELTRKDMMKTEKKRGADRSQPEVRDEWWTDERIQTYLNLETSAHEAPDFHVLLKAYRGMVPESFGRFINFFVADGRNLNEVGPDGRTISQVVAEHRTSGQYLEILKKAGAM